MAGIAEIIGKSDLEIGKDYQVITISIDYKENMSLARSKKASYMKTIRNGNARQYWHFYVADSSAIKTLTDLQAGNLNGLEMILSILQPLL